MNGLRYYWQDLGRGGQITLLVILASFAATYIFGEAPRVLSDCEISWDGRSNPTICK